VRLRAQRPEITALSLKSRGTVQVNRMGGRQRTTLFMTKEQRGSERKGGKSKEEGSSA